jgi:hypothetical protein
MAVEYRHTQPATAILVGIGLTMVLILALFAWIGISVPTARWPLTLVAIATFAFFALLAWLFSSMTVVVTDEEVRWHFGPGLHWRIARADIAGVSIARHSWLAGYGIRWFGPDRWVYAVSGPDTVELRLKQGGWRRLGTDDPQGLLRALTAAAPA